MSKKRRCFGEIRVCGIDYKLFVISELEWAELDQTRHTIAFGVDSIVSRAWFEYLLFHEVCHIIEDIAGLEVTDGQISTLSRVMMAFLRDNHLLKKSQVRKLWRTARQQSKGC